MKSAIAHIVTASLLCSVSFLASASTLNVRILNAQTRFELGIKIHQLGEWQTTQKGNCTYFSKVTESYSGPSQEFFSGYHLQARFSCTHNDDSSDYMLLPELFISNQGTAEVSFGESDKTGFHYQAGFS